MEKKRKLSLKEISDFIQKNIHIFHDSRLKRLQETDLQSLLRRKNPYLFRAKNILTAQELIGSFLEARLSSSEEELFGNFLEELAIFVAKRNLNAVKSSTTGLDIEYGKKGVRYLVAIKSGLNWGNSSQWSALYGNFNNAMKVLRQSKSVKHIQPILGICYGKARTTLKGNVTQVCGQSFWFMLTGDKEFYKKIIEPLGYKAKERNEHFNEEKAKLINKMTKELLTDFCDSHGKILWDKLIEVNSKNLTDLDEKQFS